MREPIVTGAAGPPRGTPDVTALVAQARAGHPRAVARLISLVEDDHPALPAVMAALTAVLSDAAGAAGAAGRSATGGTRVIGLTGAPGVGKSTMTSALVSALRARGRRVAVLAVDPSSPFSGGALLGDRIRMTDHALDPDVYIRSMASRGHLGGLARATPQALRVLAAAGFDDVLVETVGVGQSEVEVAAHADTTVVLLAPRMGDGIQAAKAGILEVGDVFVVNKADTGGAEATVRDLRAMLGLGRSGALEPSAESDRWAPPVLRASAATGEGLADVVRAIDEHTTWAGVSGAGRRRRRGRATAEVEAIVLGILRDRLDALWQDPDVSPVAADLLTGAVDPYGAAEAVLRRLMAAEVPAVARSGSGAAALSEPGRTSG